MNANQVAKLLEEASLHYIKTGQNKEEVEHYARMLIEIEKVERQQFLAE